MCSTLRLDQTGKQGRLRRKVKTVGLQLAAPLAVLAVVSFAAGGANAAHRHAFARGGLAGKIQYCQDCHGLRGQGFRGYYPIPRLAGQQPQYFENQLQAFTEGRRPHPIMSVVAHTLSPATRAALAAHFASLNPPPIGGGPRRLVEAGRAIFQNGVPDENIAACAACHGPNAQGHGQIPRLAGQLYPYVVKALTNWSKERGRNPAISDTSAIMSPVAHSLNRSQAKAVAAYVSTLR